jgi:hypothetical protein
MSSLRPLPPGRRRILQEFLICFLAGAVVGVVLVLALTR